MVRGQIDSQVKEASDKMEKSMITLGPGINKYSKLPVAGWTAEQVKKEMHQLSEMKHTKWEDGRVSGAVYHGGQDLLDVQIDAFGTFMVANPIHPDVFPGVRKMEAEVVAMVCAWKRDMAADEGLTRRRCCPCLMRLKVLQE